MLGGGGHPQIAQAFLKESPRAALLFDEVEDVFPPVQGQTADLLARQELTGRRVAVELNLDIVPRSQHAETVLKAGDQVEVVHAIGGG